jgi:recombination protein RecT
VKADGKDVDKKLDQREQAKAVAKTVRSLSEDPAIQKRFNEVLGDEKIARSFMASVLSAINATPALMQCDPFTVWGSAMQAAALDLPVDKNLGFAAIVPYKGKAQFQIMRGGYIQLAQRTREYKTVHCAPVFEGEIVENNPITGEIKFSTEPNKHRDSEDESKIVGYAAYFKLLNGFEKTIYWTREKVLAHATRYSSAMKSGHDTLWKSDFHAMAMKTVLKQLLVKWGPLTAFTRKAAAVDQSTTDDLENPLDNIQYADRPDDSPPELDSIPGIAKGAKTKEDEIF